MFSLFMDLIYGLENRQTLDWSGGKGARRTEERLQLLQITTSSPFTSTFDLHLPPSFHSLLSQKNCSSSILEVDLILSHLR